LVAASALGLWAAPVWGRGLALILLIPVFLLPLQPLLTGNNLVAVGAPGAFRQGWSWRLPLAFMPGLFQGAGLALLVVAFARPMEVKREIERTQPGLDILLAIDTSCSMEATDMEALSGRVTRLEVAKGVAAEFVAGRPQDRIGVVVFGEEAFTHVPLTLDHKTLTDVLDQVQIGIAGARGTAVGTAIAVSSKRLLQIDNPERILILVTDGQSNAGKISPLEAADAAAEVGIRIYTIGVGARRRGSVFGLLMGGDDGPDEETLTRVAERTGGAYFRATTTDALRNVYLTIDQLEASPAEVREDIEEIDWYRYPLSLGILLYSFGLLVSWFGLRRWP
jgi:Ca-activated chloride channel family protein